MMFGLPFTLHDDSMPLDFVDIEHHTHPVDPKIRSARCVCTNSQALAMGDVFVISLKDDGSYDKTLNLSDMYFSAKDRAMAAVEAGTNGWTVKVERMESYNREIYELSIELGQIAQLPVNCHFFWGQQGKGSFDFHEDDGHVWIYMVKGVKRMLTQNPDRTFELNAGDWLFMPKGTKHKAINVTETEMLSFGSFSYWGNAPHFVG